MDSAAPEGVIEFPSTRQGPGVLVLHAWWGLNPFFRDVCKRLAQSGFIAFAPDLYHGEVATTVADAARLSDALEQARVQADLREAISYLKGTPGVTSRTLGAIGFSLGANLALDSSRRHPQEIGAVVSFYGTYPGDYESARASYLGHFAESDEWEPTEGVQQLETRLRAAHRPVKFYTYPGTHHWFFETNRPDEYDAEAASLAWRRTLAFLKEELL
jgi:carboxymethylenebutenolidase